LSAMLSVSDPGLRRVSVNAGNAIVDLVLPAGLPVAELVPGIVDILNGHGGDRFGDPSAKRYQLAQPGSSALPASATLAQSGILDGEILVLSQSPTPLPDPRYDDVADAVSATIDATARPWTDQPAQVAAAVAASFFTSIGCFVLVRNAFNNIAIHGVGSTAAVAGLAGFVAMLAAVVANRVHRSRVAAVTLNLIAVGFAAAAGFLAVPDVAGGPNVLLAASAAAVTSVLAIRVTGCGVVALAASACFATVIAACALVAVITASPLHTISSVCALISLGLLGSAGRASIVIAGLAPQLPPVTGPDSSALERVPEKDLLAARAARADHWQASLLAAFASSAAAGAVTTALAGTSRPSCVAFAAIVGALLLLRARHNSRWMPVFAATGILTTGATFAFAALSAPGRGPWIAATTAALAAAAIYLGFVVPATSFSPVVRRCVDLLEYLALIAIVPLTCWICGLYGAVRGLSPS
jgi:type VII secretion integral membrane protein EccD